MFRKFTSRTFFVLPAILCLSLSTLAVLSGCSRSDEPVADHSAGVSEMVVLQTDSDEWRVHLFKEHLFYSEAVETNLPAPWAIPSREEAQVLKTLSYPCKERFITSDGYTFAMPGPTVSKAGSKTRYSVLGLWRRKTTIDVPF